MNLGDEVIIKFDLVKSNIINVPADAIVLPANSKLKEGSGTSAAIFEAAGRRDLTKACKKIGFCEVGSAVPTLAYNLNAKFIIHAVIPKWIDGRSGEYDLLRSACSTIQFMQNSGILSFLQTFSCALNKNKYGVDTALTGAAKNVESYGWNGYCEHRSASVNEH